MRLDTVVGYTYKADTYCSNCIVRKVGICGEGG